MMGIAQEEWSEGELVEETPAPSLRVGAEAFFEEAIGLLHGIVKDIVAAAFHPDIIAS
jgi:hypothetical protein